MSPRSSAATAPAEPPGGDGGVGGVPAAASHHAGEKDVAGGEGGAPTAEALADAVKRLSVEDEPEWERPPGPPADAVELGMGEEEEEEEEEGLEEGLGAREAPTSVSDAASPDPCMLYRGKGALAPFCGLTELVLLNAGLDRLPSAVGDLVALEVLNCGGNVGLRELPVSMGRCSRLRVCFFLGCGFEAVPAVLGCLPSLFMLSFKNCRLERLDLASLAPSLGWLILTGNRLVDLPQNFGARVPRIRKLMLASNALKTLPVEGMAAHMHELELLRLSDNALSEFPEELFLLPRLAWVALAGNPCVQAASSNASRQLEDRNFPAKVPAGDVEGIVDGEVLGTGTSGAVRKGAWRDSEAGGARTYVAVKVFDESAKTSDGNPRDELLATSAASSARVPGIVPILGQLHFEEGGGSSGQVGLLCTLLEGYQALGGPPSLSSVTRDTYPDGFSRTLEALLRMARRLSRTLCELHRHGICHGDVYSHNLLIRRNYSSGLPDGASKDKRSQKESIRVRGSVQLSAMAVDEDCRLSDFGAAWFYRGDATFASNGSGEAENDAKPLRRASRLGGEPYCKPYEVEELVERVEVRAFGIWLSEMLSSLDLSHGAQVPPALGRLESSFASPLRRNGALEDWARWAAGDCAWLHAVADACMSEQVADRPTFATVVQWIG